MKAVSSTAILIVLGATVILVLVGIWTTRAQSQELPRFNNEAIAQEERVAAFVDSFLKRDFIAGQLLNPSFRTLFAQGYRPTIGVPHNPEAKGKQFTDIRSYFIRKLYLDLNAIQPLSQARFESFVDQIGRYGHQTLTCAAEIVIKYNLKVDGRFNFETELKKVPQGREREEFKRCWLNDAILGTELRMLGWVYRQLFGAPYVLPEER